MPEITMDEPGSSVEDNPGIENSIWIRDSSNDSNPPLPDTSEDECDDTVTHKVW
jgi:hypothetical protein